MLGLRTFLVIGLTLIIPLFFTFPVDASASNLRSELYRVEGQTAFLNPLPWYYGKDVLSMMNKEGVKTKEVSGSKRDIQESDIFKVGEQGQKLLYLLNNYRGLQVVSFADGAENPQLLGRTEASGNWSDVMYRQEKFKRLLGLENYWSRGDEDNYTQLVSFDISDSNDPKIAQTLRMDGYLIDSRMVGNILYVATRSSDMKGHIYSFQLDHHQITQVDTLQLAESLAYGELMNIVEVPLSDGGYEYYLLAVLMGKNSHDWMHQQVAVIDISSAEGKIIPLMKSEIKGTIRERSQISIKDGHLITVSNYVGKDERLRIAVESFSLPITLLFPLHEVKNVIPQVVADYRRFRLEEAYVAKKAEKNDPLSEEAFRLYQEQLVTGQILFQGENLAIKGYFVRLDDGMLSPLLPQAVVTVGSSEALSASIQDVRFQNNLLYVYWVPQNQVDPLDIFDISHPEKDISYKGRLFFDGWIERAQPIEFKGRHFIVGMGQIVATVNNETGRRRPQVMLFELDFKKSIGNIQKEVLSQMTIGQDGRYWTNFNASDKMTEIRFDESTGTGSMLFQVYRQTAKAFESGGKIIGFNLTKTDEVAVFTEGGFLKASQGWLRRVFTNPELDKINSFSDMSLDTFDVTMDRVAEDHQRVYKSLSTLELARNIDGYFTLESEGQIYGVQMVTEESWISSDASYALHLRLVDSLFADSEKSRIIDEVVLNLRPVQTFIADKGTVLLYLQEYRDDGAIDYLASVTVVDGKIQVQKYALESHPVDMSVDANINTTGKGVSHRFAGPWWWREQRNLDSFIRLKNGLILFVKDQMIYRLAVDDESKLLIKEMQRVGCEEKGIGISPLEFKQLGGKLYFHYYQEVQDDQVATLYYRRHFLQPMEFLPNREIVRCQKSINIPGKPLSIISMSGDRNDRSNDKYLVTEDKSVIDFLGDDFSTQDNLTATSLGGQRDQAEMLTATLTDLYDAEKINLTGVQMLPSGTLVFVEGQNRNHNGIYPLSSYKRVRYWQPDYRQYQKVFFIYFRVNSLGHFVKESYQIMTGVTETPTLTQYFVADTNTNTTRGGDGLFYGVLRNSNEVRVLVFGEDQRRPKIIQLERYNTHFQKQEPSDVIIAKESYWGGWNQNNSLQVHFTPGLDSFELSEGLYGISQFFITRF